ncbi:flagellar hook-associated protein FlgL [Shewanella intestini]|uniref:Flagellar hook-associated protein FlgL n=1 Tax=Shewanella intestini TaxID=2017544 RepID=A0ABS5HYA0_9GAMM|nr:MULTISPECIES: flagellar hook-associated protein FlgL [Shewanella]MBR9726757.1 flagellar hook-associated protein FlgL [Shewanella intestini]MRG34677.1 flagellar hook-associated protein FlgL [Shewanella sp. XMDDZSB0408]
MRVSTGQIYNQTASNILQKQSETNKVLDQLMTGKRVNTSGDDPVASIGIDNLNQRNALVDQYVKNIEYTKNRLGVTEGKISSTESLLNSMREDLQRGANGSLATNERQMVAEDMKNSLNELMSIANSQDESGHYLFGGTQVNTIPFAFDANGSAVYSGDSGVRNSVVSSDVLIAANAPGDSVFMNAPNPLGDYGVNYLPSQQGDFTVESAKISNTATHVSGQYTFNFVDNAGVTDLQVVDPTGTTTTFANYDPSTPVTVNGLEVKLDGKPVAGDSITLEPQETVSILDSMNDAIAFLEDPDAVSTPQNKSKLAQLLNNIDSGQNQVSTARSTAGNSLKSLENLTSTHEDEKVINSSALSLLEDLDYSKAVTDYKQHELALDAVSSAFSKVGNMSLFNYI